MSYFINNININNMEMESALKNESNETILITEEDGIQYSDFENVEYEEVGEDVYSKDSYEHSSFNSMKNYHRKRTRNFSQNECNLICAILEEYYEIIENKRNDHKTNFLKNKAWSEITQKFNDHTKDEYRTALQLRTFYENLKKKRKKLYKESENGESMDVSVNQIEKIVPQSDILTQQSKILLRDNQHVPQESYKKTSFIEEYHKKKIELVETEIQKVKAASEQQHRLFLLQEEKLMLEIQEIKQRIKHD